jgi:hypothetical protein
MSDTLSQLDDPKLRTEAAVGESPAPALNRVAMVVFVALSALLPLGFALLTDHTWEDFFITFRHSQNLVDGKGLVYQPGERIHGFTSPLGTLLPALGYWLTGADGSYERALWFLRITSAIALAGAAWLLIRTAARGGAGRWALVPLALLFLFDIKAAAFSVNGMETAFMLLFVLWGFWLAGNDERSWLVNGVCWAALMWTRPDGCIYIAIFSLLIMNYGEGERRDRLLGIVKSAVVCALLYLPWFVWTWSYYGTPVPHTIVAKSHLLMLGGTAPPGWIRIGILLPEKLAAPFQPAYYEWGGWPTAVHWISLALGVFCATYWLLPVQDRLGKMASLAYLLLSMYLGYVTIVYPWYLPPVAVFGYLTLALGLTHLAGLRAQAGTPDGVPQAPSANRRGLRPLPIFAGGLLVLLCVGQLALYVFGAEVLAVRQAEVERGLRIPLALWLKERLQPGDRIYLEPLGYIGYFSGGKMLDCPGLVAPEAIAAIDAGARDQAELGLALKPEWMVLRPWEKDLLSKHEEFQRTYTEVNLFDVRDRVAEYGQPVRDNVKFDAAFHVFRRNTH